MAVVSITAATQQYKALQRVSCLKDGLERLRLIVSSGKDDRTGEMKECFLQHDIWQTPIMLLNVGIILFVLGLLIFVFCHPILDLGSYAHQSTAVIIVFGIAVVYTIGSYLLSWLGLYHKRIKLERLLEHSQPFDSAV